MPVVVEADPLPEGPRAWLADRAHLIRPCQHDLHDALADAEGLVIRTRSGVDTALIDIAPRLRVIARAGVGLDHVDLEACRARGVRVVHTPEANSDAVCEYVWAMVFDAVRPRLFLDRAVDGARWESLRAELVAPRELHGLTLGVYGFGRIGSRVARVGRALGMRVLTHDLRELAAGELDGAEQVGREQLLAESDVLSVHVDGRAANRGLLDADAFGRMRGEVVFVNTSRGAVVDHAACARFMTDHPGACALLDVHEPEPFTDDHPLLGVPNAHLSPHIASATEAAKDRMGWVVRDLWAVLDGREPRFEADRTRGV